MRADHRPVIRARPTDRVEDVAGWLLVILAVAVVGLGVLVGRAGHDQTLAAQPDRLLADATLIDTALTAPGPPVAVARWAGPDGTPTLGRVPTTAHAPGRHLPLRVDRATGAPVAAPVDPSIAVIVGWTWGVAVVVAGWAFLVLAWLAVRALTGRANAHAWTREWASVEPLWSRRAG